MSCRTPTKSRVKVCNKSVFHLQDKKADENELSIGLIKSAKRTGQLTLCNRGLGTGKVSLKYYIKYKYLYGSYGWQNNTIYGTQQTVPSM